MIYVIPGIAICGALLGEMGAMIFNVTKTLKTISIFRSREGHKSHPLFWVVYIVFSFGFFLFIPAAIVYFFKTEWGFFESIYFMMVTFTTVGFGNLTIHDHHWKFLILIINFIG